MIDRMQPHVRQIIQLIAFGLLFSCTNCHRAGWGDEEEGEMTWTKARELCDGKGMRLPTVDELMTVYTSGLYESWKSGSYWSADDALYLGKYPYDQPHAYFVYITNGRVDHFVKDSDDVFSQHRVRCFR